MDVRPIRCASGAHRFRGHHPKSHDPAVPTDRSTSKPADEARKAPSKPAGEPANPANVGDARRSTDPQGDGYTPKSPTEAEDLGRDEADQGNQADRGNHPRTVRPWPVTMTRSPSVCPITTFFMVAR